MWIKMSVVLGAALLSPSAFPAAVPQLVRADATEQRERCLAGGGRLQGSVFDSVVASADLNADGLQDYVLSNAKTVCSGGRASGRDERHSLRIVIGTRDGRGRLAYEGEAVSARLDRNERLPVVALRMAGAACSNDLAYYARGQQPVCWRNLAWRAHLNRFELIPIKSAKPQSFGAQ